LLALEPLLCFIPNENNIRLFIHRVQSMWKITQNVSLCFLTICPKAEYVTVKNIQSNMSYGTIQGNNERVIQDRWPLNTGYRKLIINALQRESDGQPFNQFQQNEQFPLIPTRQT
jgi:hypothetical protein